MEYINLYARVLGTVMTACKNFKFAGAEELQCACRNVEATIEEDNGEVVNVAFDAQGILTISIEIDEVTVDDVANSPFMMLVGYFDSMQFQNIGDRLRVAFAKHGLITSKE